MTQKTAHLTRAVIVSHGQPSEPDVGEAEIKALAAEVSAFLPNFDLRGATLAAPGALEEALSGATPDALIYPFFMADGWFTKKVLPQRLEGFSTRILPPFGLDPALPSYTAEWLFRVLNDQGWRAEDTRLFLAGHGSGKSPLPAQVTRDFGAKLQGLLEFQDLRCGFVEEAPFLADVAQGLGDKAICLPFFALKRGHVLIDLPEALEAAQFTGIRLDPFGCQPDLPAFIARSLRDA